MQRVPLERITRIWAHWPEILHVWLFGSARDGHVRPGSDVDFGLLFDDTPSLDSLADIRASLQEALAIEDIDLVVLNGASSALRFEAVTGPCIYSNDPDGRAEFVSLTAREYEDEMGMLHSVLGAAGPATAP